MSYSAKKKHIVIFTDGSCSNNGKINSFGGIGIHFPNKELKDISKVYRLGVCTNQKTELYAILTAIRYIGQNFPLHKCHILIKTDSQYSIDCITKWINGWLRNNFITKAGKPVLNREFIEIIHKYYEKYSIEFSHVDAHTDKSDSDSNGNRVADSLATAATRKAQMEGNVRVELKNLKDKIEPKFKSSTRTRESSFIPNKNIRKNSRFPSLGNDLIVELIKSK